MGLFDFFKKDEKPAQQKPTPPKPAPAAKPQSAPAAQAAPKPASQPAAQPSAPSVAQPEFYTVKSGDSLSKIAQQLYGDAQQWKRIFDANQDQIKNPDLIQPGQKFKIPR